MGVERAAVRGERGAAGGAEVLAFGVLLLLAGSLLTTNLWSIIETRVAIDAAAREYMRSYTRSTDRSTALANAEQAARSTLAARGTPLMDLRISPPAREQFGPCGLATVRLEATVPAARIPFVGELGSARVDVTHRALVDAHREITPSDGFDPTSTACATGDSAEGTVG